MIMIIATGCDNSGKTTMIEFLVKEFGLKKTPRYRTLPPKDYDDWFRHVHDILSNNTFLGIADRLYTDELVYGPICRNKTQLTEIQIALMNRLISHRRPLFIICDPGEESIRESYNDREQYTELDSNIKVREGYQFLMKEWPFSECPVIFFNYNEDPEYKELVKKVQVYFEYLSMSSLRGLDINFNKEETKDECK